MTSELYEERKALLQREGFSVSDVEEMLGEKLSRVTPERPPVGYPCSSRGWLPCANLRVDGTLQRVNEDKEGMKPYHDALGRVVPL
jgi:hypothetical protein